MTILYCPRCAYPMREVDGMLTCEPGRMPLSPLLERTIRDRFGPHAKERASAPQPGAELYCPACRVAVDEDLGCPECGQSLADLRFAIVELHPHLLEE